MNLAKVWPLKPGLTGCTHEGRKMPLQPGIPGFMEYAAAVEAETRGELQLMAGQTPESLKIPSYETREMSSDEPTRVATPARRKKAYARRDMVAEKPGT